MIERAESTKTTKASQVEELDLEHIKGDKWVANTPDGRRVVQASTVSFEPVISYQLDDGRLMATRVRGLTKLTNDRELPKSVWNTD